MLNHYTLTVRRHKEDIGNNSLENTCYSLTVLHSHINTIIRWKLQVLVYRVETLSEFCDNSSICRPWKLALIALKLSRQSVYSRIRLF